MSHIRSVMLLSLNSDSYRRFLAVNTIQARANSGERTKDPRAELTSIVEEEARQILARNLFLTEQRVLRWEEDVRSRYVQRFRELDGVFELRDGTKVIVEVKASASKSSIKKGVAQLNYSLQILRKQFPGAIGLLVIADLSKFSELFGQTFFDLDELELEVCTLDWPPTSANLSVNKLNLSFVPHKVLSTWLPESFISTLLDGFADEEKAYP